jgi:hypothetical protein
MFIPLLYSCTGERDESSKAGAITILDSMHDLRFVIGLTFSNIDGILSMYDRTV